MVALADSVSSGSAMEWGFCCQPAAWSFGVIRVRQVSASVGIGAWAVSQPKWLDATCKAPIPTRAVSAGVILGSEIHIEPGSTSGFCYQSLCVAADHDEFSSS